MAFLQYTSPTIMENVLFPASAQLQHNSVHLQSSTPITYYSLHESNVLPVRLVLMLLFIIDDVNFPVNSLSLSTYTYLNIREVNSRLMPFMYKVIYHECAQRAG